MNRSALVEHLQFVRIGLQLVERRQQLAAVVEPAARDVEPHVANRVALAARIERPECRAERMWFGTVLDARPFVAILRINFVRVEQREARHPGVWMIRPRQPRANRAHAEPGLPLPNRIGPTGQHVNDGLNVSRNRMLQAPHHRHLVSMPCELRKCPAEGRAGQRRRHLAGHAAVRSRALPCSD